MSQGLYEIGCQPCHHFKPEDLPHEVPTTHECPSCDSGFRRFCVNCNADHHACGWDTCSFGEERSHPQSATCMNGLCLVARAVAEDRRLTRSSDNEKFSCTHGKFKCPEPGWCVCTCRKCGDNSTNDCPICRGGDGPACGSHFL